MKKRLAVIINPTAGRGRAVVIGRQVRERLEAQGHEVRDVSGATAEEAKAKLRTATSTWTLDGVIAVGGDGLINLAASVLVRADLPLAVIPAGTGDDIARGLEIPLRPARSIAALIKALEKPQIPTRTIDVARVHSGEEPALNNPPAYRYFLSALTGGLDARVNARANGLRFPRGKSRYVFALLNELRSLRSYTYDLVIDGRYSQRELTLICVANMPYFGAGMQIAPAARPDSKGLEIVLVREVSLLKLLWIFPRIFWGGHVRHPAVEVLSGQRIEIGDSHGNQLPTPFGDGEPIAAPPVRCEVLPGALRVVQLG